MMHWSRLCSFVIDCRTDDIDAATTFWSEALGRKAIASEANYRTLATAVFEPILLTQQVEHESRVHLDIETNDFDAEVARLERLGAKRIAFVHRWWVMQAPSGQRFCVVRPQGEHLTMRKNYWNADGSPATPPLDHVAVDATASPPADPVAGTLPGPVGNEP